MKQLLRIPSKYWWLCHLLIAGFLDLYVFLSWIYPEPWARGHSPSTLKPCLACDAILARIIFLHTRFQWRRIRSVLSNANQLWNLDSYKVKVFILNFQAGTLWHLCGCLGCSFGTLCWNHWYNSVNNLHSNLNIETTIKHVLEMCSGWNVLPVVNVYRIQYRLKSTLWGCPFVTIKVLTGEFQNEP